MKTRNVTDDRNRILAGLWALGMKAVQTENEQAAAHTRAMAKREGVEMADEAGDIYLGDVTISQAAQEKPKSGLGTLAKIAIGAGLLGTGVGGGVGAAMLLDGGKEVVEKAVETGGRYGLELGKAGE